MGKYITATEAAKRLGVTDKTVRTWIKNGDLKGEHVQKNRLAILASDVEKLRRKRENYQSDDKQDVSLLLLKIEELTEKCSGFERKCSEVERKYLELSLVIEELRNSKPVSAAPAVVPVLEPMEKSKKKVSSDLPPGCVLVGDFAKRYGVARTTFVHHIEHGIGGEKVEVERRPKPGFTNREEKYLTPDQQAKAIEFWNRHNVRYVLKDDV